MTTRSIRNVVISILLVVIFLAVAAGVSSWRGRNALGRWKQQMRARGEKLALQEFRPGKSSTPVERAPLMAAGSQVRKSSSFYVGALEPMKGAGPGRAVVLWKSEEVAIEKTNVAWAVFRREIEGNAKALDAVRAALRNPTLDLGWDYVDPLKIPMNPLVMKRSVAQWLRAAVVEELHETNLVAAADSVRALLALARVDENDATLVNQMIRVAILQLGLEVIWECLQAEGWADRDLAVMAEELNKVKLLEQFARTAEVERAMAINIFERIRHGTLDRKVATSLLSGTGWGAGFDQYALQPVWQIAWSDQDELFFLECMQPVIEGFRHSATNKSWQGMRALMNPGFARLQRLSKNRFDQLRYQLTEGMMVSWERATTNLMRAEAFKEMARTALALKRSQIAHGRVPGDLKELLPHYLSQLPQDPMDGQPLRYRVETNGQWTLYSIGTDLYDAGGDATPLDPKAVSYRPERGRDIVWPKP